MGERKFNPDWLTGVFTVVLACTGIGALWYAHQQITEAHEEAKVQHLLSLLEQYDHEPMVTYRKVCAQKRLEGIEDPPEESRVLDFFETVGVLVNRDYLKDTDVWENFSNEIFYYYADTRDTIEQEQKEDRPEYSNLTALVMRLETIEAEHQGTLSRPSKEDMKNFWQDEVAVGVGTPTTRRKPSTPKH